MSDFESITGGRKPRIDHPGVSRTLGRALELLREQPSKVAKLAETLPHSTKDGQIVKAAIMLAASEIVQSQPEPSLDKAAVLARQSIKSFARTQPRPTSYGPLIHTQTLLLRWQVSRMK